MSSLQTLPKGDSAWLLRKAIERIIQQVSVLETNIGSSTTGNSANTQIIFNDNGVLRGDAGLTYNATTDLLTVASATITGDLTVDSSTLKVDSANNRVGIGTASPAETLTVAGKIRSVSSTFGLSDIIAETTASTGTGYARLIAKTADREWRLINDASTSGSPFIIYDATAAAESLKIATAGVYTFGDGAGGTRMTLNSTGLGVGASPSYKFHVAGSANDLVSIYSLNTNNNASIATSNAIKLGFTSTVGTHFATFKITEDGANDNSGGLTIDLPYGGVESTKMTITSSGNVGVGVTPKTWSTIAPALQIGSAGAFLASQGSTEGSYLGSNVAYYSGSFNYVINGFATFYRQQNGVHSWHNAASGVANNAATFTQAMTLDASGNLLVGTTSASNQERLNLTSNRNVYIGRFFNSASSGGNYGFLINYSAAAPNNASNEFLACSDNAASRLFLYSNGGIANYQANDSNLSDIRTKTDIKPLASYWNKIKALELVTFKYKDQTHNDDNIGLIAQQVESVAPEFIDADGFGETPDDGVPIKTIYTTDLYHASIKALQEAMARIEALEAKLA